MENFQLWSGMADVGDNLLAAAKPQIPARLLKESTRELLMSTAPVVVMGEYRLRPPDDYFVKTGSPVPRPANPSGPDACGVELSLMFCRGYPQAFPRREPIRANSHLTIQFSVWGRRERLALLDLFADHRRLVERLLDIPGLVANTATGEAEGMSRRTGAFECLSRYTEIEDDPENYISISKEFPAEARVPELLTALVPLSILYDACYGYCKPRKARDRLLAYAAGLIGKTAVS
ncbi:hypothetical protein [Variovorax sp. W6]|uniref:hypothetical protein n=1 Tax=Variovorax sp. W6 TaxID=3093895 RepID=UPI003D806D0F